MTLVNLLRSLAHADEDRKDDRMYAKMYLEEGATLRWWERLFLRRVIKKLERGKSLSDRESERLSRIGQILSLRQPQT